MFYFGTNHTQNGGTASCRSAVFFGLEEEGRGRERDSEEDGRGIGGCERTLRGRKRTKRTEEDGEDFEVGGKRDSDQDETMALRRRNKNLEKDGNGTLRREKKGIGNHVIL